MVPTDGTGTTSPSRWINYLRMILREQSLREFDELASQNGGLTNNCLKLITEGLLRYFFPVNSLSKQKRVMSYTMHKAQVMTFKHFAAQLIEMNNFLLLFHV